jgi:hypothetical protein
VAGCVRGGCNHLQARCLSSSLSQRREGESRGLFWASGTKVQLRWAAAMGWGQRRWQAGKLDAGHWISLDGRSVQHTSLARKQWSSSRWPFFAAQWTSRRCRPQASCEWLQVGLVAHALHGWRSILGARRLRREVACVWLGGPTSPSKLSASSLHPPTPFPS